MKVPEQEPAELPQPEPVEDGNGAPRAEDPAEHLLSNLPEDLRSAWGKPIELESKELERVAKDLQSDLQLIVADLKRGPLAQMLDDAHEYLGELRREFLRHHRRLVIQVRTPEGCAELSGRVHFELAEFAERFRGVALGRVSRLRQAWRPQELIEAIDRVVDGLPEIFTTQLEPISYSGYPGQGA